MTSIVPRTTVGETQFSPASMDRDAELTALWEETQAAHQAAVDALDIFLTKKAAFVKAYTEAYVNV